MQHESFTLSRQLLTSLQFSLAVLTNEHIGGLSGLYEKVKATNVYIPGNYEGSLLTMKSRSCKSSSVMSHAGILLIWGTALLFGLVLKFGNLALVLMDTAFWQKSFASEVQSVVPAYDLVSVVILAIPWCTGTIIGLSARAIEKTPVWFDYPNTLTTTQVNSGLVMPYVLRSLLGPGATAGLLVLIFMAITSTVSSSMIAVSSIISLDFFSHLRRPSCVGPQDPPGEPLGSCLPRLLYGWLCYHARVRWGNKQLVHLLPAHRCMSWHPSHDLNAPLV